MIFIVRGASAMRIKNSTRRFRAFLIIALPALLAFPAAAQEKPAEPAPSADNAPLTLSLEECIVQAAKNNLGVAVQVTVSRQADSALVRAGEKFLPSLSFDLTTQKTNSASYSWLQSADVLSQSVHNYGGSLSQQIPFGGRLAVSLGAGRSESNAQFQTINPSYSGSLSFSLTQPLLRDFGWTTSRRDIIVAANNKDIAAYSLRTVLLDTIYSVEQAYWELVYRIEALKVRRQSLRLAEDLLDKNRKEIDIGTRAPKEILTAQAAVAARKADILQAERAVKDYSDILRGLINLPFDETAGVDIVPVDAPGFAQVGADLEQALALARRNRPDLRSSGLAVKNREVDYSYAKNQTLPALDLTANYWSPGLSGDRILYLDDNPLTGVVLGKVPGGASLAMRDALGFKYKNWAIALSLTVPLSSVLTRAAQAEAKADLDQQIAQTRSLEQSVVLEIRAAVRAVDTDYERVGAYKAARELAEQKLAAEEAKLAAGLSNNFFVLQYQQDLASAREAELRAVIDYTLSLDRLDRATAVSLDKWHIKLADAAEVGS
jgi:outer membrane protein TolC